MAITSECITPFLPLFMEGRYLLGQEFGKCGGFFQQSDAWIRPFVLQCPQTFSEQGSLFLVHCRVKSFSLDTSWIETDGIAALTSSTSSVDKVVMLQRLDRPGNGTTARHECISKLAYGLLLRNTDEEIAEQPTNHGRETIPQGVKMPDAVCIQQLLILIHAYVIPFLNVLFY